jgi:acyl carrier protein
MTTPAIDNRFEALLRRRLRNLPAGTALDAEAPLKDLGLDSMDAVELVFDIEDEMGVELPDDAMTAETFATAHSLYTAVEQLHTGDGEGS